MRKYRGRLTAIFSAMAVISTINIFIIAFIFTMVSASTTTVTTTTTIAILIMTATTATTTSTTSNFILIDNNSNTNNNSSNSSQPVSETERRQYLERLQAETTITMIPAMTFLLLLSLLGLVGNSLVLFVYYHKLRASPTTVFIMVIAAFDLLTNIVAIPGEIYDMFHIWDFDDPTLCRARLFFNAFTVISSAMVLLAVAVARYRKICRPYGWQVSTKHARVISLTIVLLGLLFSTPYAIINGKQTKETPRPDIEGSECTTDDSYVDTIWPVLNTGFFLLLFVICCGSLTVLYIMIGVKACRHSRMYGGSAASVATTKTTIGSSDTDHSGAAHGSNGEGQHETMQTSLGSSPGVNSEVESPPKKESLKAKFSRKKKSLKSSLRSKGSSVDFGSIADVMDQYKEEIELNYDTDQYDVNILEDKVEISTPMMGDFIVKLKSSTSSARSQFCPGESSDAVAESGDTRDIRSSEDGKGKEIETAAGLTRPGDVTERDFNLTEKPTTVVSANDQISDCGTEEKVAAALDFKQERLDDGGDETEKDREGATILTSGVDGLDRPEHEMKVVGTSQTDGQAECQDLGNGTVGERADLDFKPKQSDDGVGEGDSCSGPREELTVHTATDVSHRATVSPESPGGATGQQVSAGHELKEPDMCDKNSSTDVHMTSSDQSADVTGTIAAVAEDVHTDQSNNEPNTVQHEGLSPPLPHPSNGVDHQTVSSLKEDNNVHRTDEVHHTKTTTNSDHNVENVKSDKTEDGTDQAQRKLSIESQVQKRTWLQTVLHDILNKSKDKTAALELRPRSMSDPYVEVRRVTADQSACLSDGTCGQLSRHGRKFSQFSHRHAGSRKNSLSNLKQILSRSRSRSVMSSTSKTDQREVRPRRPLGKTTAMLIIISAVYAVGFLPHLGLMFYKFTNPEHFARLTMVELSFYNLFLRSYFLNSAANPIIYSLCNVQFRLDCLKFLRCRR